MIQTSPTSYTTQIKKVVRLQTSAFLSAVLSAVLTKNINIINSDKSSSALRTKILDTAKYT